MDIWLIASLHLITLTALCVVGFFCFKLHSRIEKLTTHFDSDKVLVPVDPEAVFFRSVKDVQ